MLPAFCMNVTHYANMCVSPKLVSVIICIVLPLWYYWSLERQGLYPHPWGWKLWNIRPADLSPPSDWQMNFSQSASVYRHTALDKPKHNCKHGACLWCFWKLIKRQFEARVWTWVMSFTRVEVGGASRLAESVWSVGAAWCGNCCSNVHF